MALESAAAATDPAQAFDAGGVAALGQLLDSTRLAIARTAFDEIIDECVVGPYAGIVHDSWRKSAALASLVPALGTVACDLLGFSELVLFHDHLLIKYGGGDDMDWHQDYSYLPLDRWDGLTLWIALDDVTLDNGCLYYLPGSHRLGERRASWGLSGDDDPRAGLPPIEVAVDEPGVSAPTAAGNAIAHHTLVWHRSPRNRTAAPRRTWALSLVVPAARWAPHHSPHPRSVVEPRMIGQPLEDDLLRVTASRQLHG